MLVSPNHPPNYDKIAAKFNLPKFLAAGARPIFAFAPMIYNPFSVPIPSELIAHERVHISRQGMAPEMWWDNYLASEDFRMSEELLSHVTEYLVLCQKAKNRNDRRRVFDYIAARLRFPIYGYNPPISEQRSKFLLKMALKEEEKINEQKMTGMDPYTPSLLM